MKMNMDIYIYYTEKRRMFLNPEDIFKRPVNPTYRNINIKCGKGKTKKY